MVSKPFGKIPPVIISTVLNFFIFFLKGLDPAAIEPIILNSFGNFLLIFLVSFELTAKPSNAALSSEG